MKISRLIYSQNVFGLFILRKNGLGSSSVKATTYLKASFNPGRQMGGEFPSLVRIQTGPGVHSASYKMSTRAFLGVKTTESRASHPTSCNSWLWICGPLHPYPLSVFLAGLLGVQDRNNRQNNNCGTKIKESIAILFANEMASCFSSA